MKKNYIVSFVLYCIVVQCFSQDILLPENFNSNILVHGTNAPTTVWFAPSYYTPISWNSNNGCPSPGIGFSSAWNNYWSNFVRLPELNCSGLDTIILYMNASHSYFSTHPNDWCRFYMWADGGYKHNVIKVLIDSINQTHNAGANGKGFKFSEPRTCSMVEVYFDISSIVNKSNILLYIEPKCGYNNSNVFFVWFDNIGVKGTSISVNTHFLNYFEQSLQLRSSVVNDMIEIIFAEKPYETRIELYSLNGMLLFSENVPQDNFSYKISIQSLPVGYYLLLVKNNSLFRYFKIFKF